MSKIALELKDFHHVKSDDKTTTLKHKKGGHELTIMHAALNPKFQDQLKALASLSKQSETPLQESEINGEQKMANGGEAKESISKPEHEGIKSDDEKPQDETLNYKKFPKETNQKNREIQIEERKKKSHDAQFPSRPKTRKMYADPQSVVSQNDSAPQADTVKATPNELSLPQMYDALRRNPQLMAAMAKHGQVSASEDSDSSNSQNQSTQDQSQESEGQGYEEAQVPGVSPAEEAEMATEMASSGKIPGASNPAQPANPTMTPSPQSEQEASEIAGGPNAPIKPTGPNILDTYPQASQGVAQIANAKSVEAKAQEKAYNAAANQMLQANKDVQTNYQNAVAQQQDFIKDYKNGHINPDHYLQSMSTGQSIGTAIGLMISGMGSGLAHQTNMAYDFLNKQIDRDIAAQQVNLTKKQNLLAANTHYMGDLRAGIEMTRANLYGVLQNQVQAAAAKAGIDVSQGEGKLMMLDLAGKQQNALYNAAALQKTNLAIGNESQTRQIPRTQGAPSMNDQMSHPYPGTPGVSEAAPPQSENTVTASGKDEQVDEASMMGLGPHTSNQINQENKLSNNIQAENEAGLSNIANAQSAYHFPYISQPTNKAVDKIDIDKARGYQNFDQQVKELLNIRVHHPDIWNVLNPENAKLRARVATLMKDTSSQYSMADSGGVATEGKLDYYNQIMGKGPHTLLAFWNSIPKLQEIRLTQQQKYARLLQSYGINAPVPDKTLDPSDLQKSEPQYKIYKGVKYKRGPKGEAIPVE